MLIMGNRYRWSEILVFDFGIKKKKSLSFYHYREVNGAIDDMKN